MKKYYMTFTPPHPLSEGWVEIQALDLREAHEKAEIYFDLKWVFIYPKYEYTKGFFPKGRIGEIV